MMCIRAVITRSMTSLSGSGSPEIGDPNLDWVRKEVSNDPACQQLMSMLKKGFPQSIRKVHPTICPFWGVRHELSEAAKEERSRYVSHLKALLSIEMRSTLELAIGIDSNSDKNVDTILDALYAHIRASRNVAIDRVDFEKRVQRSGEKFDEFYVDLKKLARNSDYKGCCLDSRLITRLMAGCHDPEVREELMTKDITKLTLAEAVALARSKEAAKKSANVIVGSTRSVNAITPVSRDKSPSRHSRVRHKSASRQNSNSTICSQTGNSGQKGCSNCGFPTHLTKDGTCPASIATCAKCGKQGHYSHVCNSQASQGRQVNAIQVGGCITY